MTSSFLVGDVGEIMQWFFNDMEEEGTLTIGESLVISIVKLV
jgi:hypothetical protein